MKTLIQSELSRLVIRRRTIIILILSILAFLFLAFFNSFFGSGFYDPNQTATLDALNFAPFVLRDYHFYLVLVLCPLLVVESFNRERTSGEYRMVMIRPYSRRQFYSAKIISLAIVIGVLVFILWILAMILGSLVLPKSTTTSFFNPKVSYTMVEAIFFSFKFYLIEYFMLVAIISVVSSISLLLASPLLSYVASIFLLFGLGFSTASFEFLAISTRSIFDLLLGIGAGWHVILSLIVVLGLGTGSSYVLFKRNDYLS